MKPVALVAGLLVGAAAITLAAPPAPRPEPKIKAAFLYNFAKLVQWPAGTFPATNTPLRIGVCGDEVVARLLLELVRDKQIEGRALTVVAGPGSNEVAGCHVLYLGLAAAPPWDAWLAELQGRPVLTVGEAAEFTARGGMIRLVHEADRIRFEINTNAADRAGLGLSSKLLRLATIVAPPASPEAAP